MKMTIDSHGFRNAFANFGRQDQFSHNGLQALFNHLEDIEQVGGGEIELDVVSLCCDFTEFATALEAAKEFSRFTIDQGLTKQEEERQAIQFLADNTDVIPFDGGIIIQNF
jgi:hypothetical protein